jgi:hypothetical protein
LKIKPDSIHLLQVQKFYKIVKLKEVRNEPVLFSNIRLRFLGDCHKKRSSICKKQKSVFGRKRLSLLAQDIESDYRFFANTFLKISGSRISKIGFLSFSNSGSSLSKFELDLSLPNYFFVRKRIIKKTSVRTSKSAYGFSTCITSPISGLAKIVLMRFLSVRSEICLQLPSDSVSRRTPLLFSYVLRRCRLAPGISPVRI